MTPLDSIILIDKPRQWTSFDVVAKVRGEIQKHIRETTGEKRKVKVGHTGTLDPLATGLLVLAVGKATKSIQNLTKLDKVYDVEMTLGLTSTTGDSEGKLQQQVTDQQPSQSMIKAAIGQFVGEISQVPPAYSAIKVNGVRAYKLARQGKEVKLKPRSVTIYSIRDIDYAYPVVRVTVHVSSGTYIRSLVEDIGQALGTGAYMSGLRRTKVGTFDIADALAIEDMAGIVAIGTA